jgi:hypothetical protein
MRSGSLVCQVDLCGDKSYILRTPGIDAHLYARPNAFSMIHL